MAYILIKNIEPFKKDTPVKALIIYANGEIEELPWCAKLMQIPKIKLDAQAVALPSHGRLIDTDTIIKEHLKQYEYKPYDEAMMDAFMQSGKWERKEKEDGHTD